MAAKLAVTIEKYLKSKKIKLSPFAMQRLKALEREVNTNRSDFDVADVIGELSKEEEVANKLSEQELQELGGIIAEIIRS